MEKGMKVDLDIFSQQFNPVYTQICFFFGLTSNEKDSIESIRTHFQTGLDRLSKSFPWIAGQIVNEGSGPNDSGTWRIVPMEGSPRLIVKDLRGHHALSLPELKSKAFPIRDLSEDVVCSMPTRGSGVKDWPVLVVQANIVDEGLILAFMSQHTAMDMTGFGEAIRWLSKACQPDLDFTGKELAHGNVDGSKIVKFYDDSWQPDEELRKRFSASETPSRSPPAPDPSGVWANFGFSAQSLAALKKEAMRDAGAGDFVSTDDAVSALIWRSITRARLPRIRGADGETASTHTTLARTIDLRRFLDIDPEYPGNLASRTYDTQSVEQLMNESISETAVRLRAAIKPETSTIAHRARAYATLLSRTADKSSLSTKRPPDPSLDVNLSSWAKFSELHELEFGLDVGKPLAVRRPWFTPELSEGIVYLLPKDLGGSMVVGLCLREDDMERLKTDQELARFAQWIG